MTKVSGDGPQLIFEVEDNGRGIAADDLERDKLDNALHSLDQFIHLLDKEGDQGTITDAARVTLTESARAVMSVLGV